MNNFNDPSSLRRLTQGFESPSVRFYRELQKSIEGTAFRSRYAIAEEEIRRSMRQTALGPYAQFEAQLERSVSALQRHSLPELLRSANLPYADPMAELTRSIRNLAQTGGWFDGDDEDTAIALSAASDVEAPEIDVKPSGEIVVDDEIVPAAEAKKALAAAAEVTASLASQPATKQDLAEGLASLEANLVKKLGKSLHAAVLAFVLSSVKDVAIEIGAQPLWQKLLTGKQQSVSAPAAPPRYEVAANVLHLRSEPSLDAPVREKLKEGDVVELVKHGENGWSLVRTQIHGDSYETGWVGTLYLKPTTR